MADIQRSYPHHFNVFNKGIFPQNRNQRPVALILLPPAVDVMYYGLNHPWEYSLKSSKGTETLVLSLNVVIAAIAPHNHTFS